MLKIDSHKPIWSLHEMLVGYAYLYCCIENEISDLEANLRTQVASAPPHTGRIILNDLSKSKTFIGLLDILKNNVIKVRLPSVRSQIVRIEDKLKVDQWEFNDAITHIRELRNRLQDDLQSQHFLYVPDDMVSYYQNAAALFGDVTISRFPTIIDDAESAGHCLALGEGTACVLHLMRVMEVGLKALSSSLGIPYAPSWEAHLRHIEKNISEKSQNKTDDWKKDEPFYRDVSGDLMTVKQAWRNPTMHVGRKYGADEAKEIFNAVRNFLNRLAEGIPATFSSVVQFPSLPV